jgi:hypothetical protein
MSDTKPRRLIVPAVRSPDGTIIVTKLSTVQGTLDKALMIVDDQINKLAIQSKHGTFADRESKILQGYVKALVDLSKEEREREKANKDSEGFENMTEEEILNLAKEKLAKVKSENKSS